MNFMFLYSVPDLHDALEKYKSSEYREVLALTDPLEDRQDALILRLISMCNMQELDKVREILDRVLPVQGAYAPYFLLIELHVLLYSKKFEEFNIRSLKFEQALPSLPPDQQTDVSSEFYNIVGLYLMMRGDLEGSMRNIRTSLKLKEQLGDDFGILRAKNNIGLIHLKMRELDEAEKIFNELVAESKNERYVLHYSMFLSNFGNLYYERGDLARALEYFDKSLKLRYIVDIPIEVAYSLNNKGSVLSRMGRLEEAVAIYNQTLAIIEKLQRTGEMQTILNNLGVLNYKRGKINEALEYYARSLELRLKDGDPLRIALVLQNMGESYRDLGDFDKASEYLEQALSHRRGTSDYLGLSDTLLELLILHLRTGKPDLAKSNLDELKLIHDENDNPVVDLRYKLGHALYLKDSPRIREKIRATDILKEIINSPVVIHQYTLMAMKALFDLLLLEYESLKEKEVMDEIYSLLDELYEIAHLQGSSSLLVETHSLQAKFALIDGNLKKSKRLLDEARTIVSEENIPQYNGKISHALESLKNEFESWSNLVNDNLRIYGEIVDVVSQLDEGKQASEVLEVGMDRFNSLSALPLVLTEYKSVLHPIKLTILKLLNTSSKLMRSDLHKLLGINSGTLEKHIKQLTEEGYLSTRVEIVGDKPRKVLYLENSGMRIYEEFRDTMKQVIATE